ncbi:MAG: hypothetical protein AAGF48_05735 [Pseudomonadota bacterium]
MVPLGLVGPPGGPDEHLGLDAVALGVDGAPLGLDAAHLEAADLEAADLEPADLEADTEPCGP